MVQVPVAGAYRQGVMLFQMRCSQPRRAGAGRASSRGRARAKSRAARDTTRGRILPTERKYVTILRVDLHRSTDLVIGLELEESIDRLVPALEAMRAAVHTHNGIVYRELGDGIFAVFGAPISEDLHAVMGCLAALDVLKRIEGLADPEIRVRVGVHSGQVVAGPKQLDFASNYEFDGPALIMVERLQSVAEPGQILASTGCRTLAEGYIRFGATLRHSLKGFPEPVDVHVVEDVAELSKWRISAARTTAAFVGRAAELKRLSDIAHTTEGGKSGGCIAIMGEGGVGKSRLARQYVETLRARDWQLVEAECSPIYGQTPFALVKAVLADIASTLRGDDVEQLEAGLSPAERAALRIVLRGDDGTKLPHWATLPPRARSRAIVAATRAVALHRIRGKPIVCLVEDLQWADEASGPGMEALVSLAERQPLVVVATARSNGLPDWFARHAASPLVLGPLPNDAGMALLDQLLGSSPRLATLKQRILQHTGAMPLFVEEVCRGLAESGILAASGNALEAASLVAELGVPLTVQGVIASRIDRLSPSEKHLLQVASAIGPRGSHQLLESVATLPSAEFQETLTALFGGAMLLPASADGRSADGTGHDGYAFPHELVRQVAYDVILSSERSALHRRVLDRLEETRVDTRHDPALAGSLVHHALQSSQWTRAAEYATAIARRSFAQSALPDAMRHYEIAMQAVDRLPATPTREAQAIDLRIEARGAYANVGKVRRWLELAQEAEARATTAGDNARRVTALAMRAAALNFCGTAAEALEAGYQAVSAAESFGNRGWHAYAQYGLGQACYIAGRYREAIDALEGAKEKFLGEGAMPPIGGSAVQAGQLCCMMSCLCHAALGDDTAAAVAQGQADEIAAQEGRPVPAIAAALSRGVRLLYGGGPDWAEASLSAALALARQHEVNLFVPIIACHHGLALFLSGRIEAAREAFDTAHTEAEALGHFSASFRAQIYKALCEATMPDRKAAALATIQVVGRLVKQQGYEPLDLEATLVEVALLRATNDEAGALRRETDVGLIGARLAAAGSMRCARRAVARLHAPAHHD